MSRGIDFVLVLGRWLARAGLLAAWTLVGWGTLLLLVTLANVASRGAGSALGLLLPSPGVGVRGWVNGFAAAVALVAWMVAVALVVLWRRGAGATRPDAPGAGATRSREAAPPEGADEGPPAG